MRGRWWCGALLLASLLTACEEEQEVGGTASVPKTAPDLQAFNPPPPPSPKPTPEPLPRQVMEPRGPEPIAPPPEPEPEEVVIEPPDFELDEELDRILERDALRRARAQTRPSIRVAWQSPDAPSDAREEDPHWRLKDEDYGRLEIQKDETSLAVDRFRVITADRYITAILENAVNSQVPGRIIGVVERHIFGADGRIPVFPKGTRIVCDYETLAKVGDTRLPVTCYRAIRPDGASVLLTDAEGADQMARTGLIGRVDNRLWEKYGTAFMVALVSAAAAVGGGVTGNPLAESSAAQLSFSLGQITTQVLQDTIDVAPVVTVAAGSRIQIIPREDIWLREPELVGGQQARTGEKEE